MKIKALKLGARNITFFHSIKFFKKEFKYSDSYGLSLHALIICEINGQFGEKSGKQQIALHDGPGMSVRSESHQNQADTCLQRTYWLSCKELLFRENNNNSSLMYLLLNTVNHQSIEVNIWVKNFVLLLKFAGLSLHCID